jgi:hypothetical protein
MAALIRIARRARFPRRGAAPGLALGVVLLALVVGGIPVLADPDDPASADETAPGVDGDATAEEQQDALPELLQQAEDAYFDARITDALNLAREAGHELLERVEGDENALEPKERAWLARSRDLVAQCFFQLGNQVGMEQAVEQLLRLDPGYVVDAEVAGERFAAIVREKRSEMVGQIRVTCAPAACDEVVIDGRSVELGEDGVVSALAGTHDVSLSRRNYRPAVLEGIEVEAGDTLDLSVELAQIARDVVFRTRPPTVQVSLDGEVLGRTEIKPAGGTVSEPFVIEGLDPGFYTLTFEAECRRTITERREIVLDATDPGPLDLGVVSLDPAEAIIDLQPAIDGASLVVDGKVVETGRIAVCPGAREVTLAAENQRLWFETLELRDGEVRVVEPRPRPTLAAQASTIEALRTASVEIDGWNVLVVPSDAGSAASEAIDALLSERPPDHPEVVRGDVGDAQRRAIEEAAGDADLLVAILEGQDPVRATQRAVLAHPDSGRWEATTISETAGMRTLGEMLTVEWQPWTAYLGFDLAERAGAPAVVASLDPEGPAAAVGLVIGDVVSEIAGETADVATLDAMRADASPGVPIALVVRRGEANEVLRLEPRRGVSSPNPQLLKSRGALLPSAVDAMSRRDWGDVAQRSAGAVLGGLHLAAAGATQTAASLLDRAALEEGVDPSGDARATVTWVLQRLLRELGDPYADEVEGRLGTLGEGRVGGRAGPPVTLAR